MNILSIGNSFSVDCQRYLPDLFGKAGIQSYIGNLYIGGCSLEIHYNNMISDAPVYEYFVNNVSLGKCRLSVALSDAEWDYITLQQASHFSGLPETYYPFLPELIAFISSRCPKARLLLNQTWAYEYNSAHNAFGSYDFSREKMYELSSSAYETAAQKYGLSLIPTGKAVESARQDETFDPEKGGLSLTRDGFHLSYVYGRFLAAAVWYETLTGLNISDNSFIPSELEYLGRKPTTGNITLREIMETRADLELIAKLKQICHTVTQHNKYSL